MKNLTIALAFLMTFSLGGCAPNVNKGLAAFEAGDTATAFEVWEPLSEQGDAVAQYNLGTMYQKGEGFVPRNYFEAVRLYRLAAEQGLAPAQGILGEAYDNGEGVPQDKVLAHMWYNIGASKGHEESGTKRKN